MLLRPRRHGFDAVAMLHKWVVQGTEPPLDTRTSGVLIDRSNFRQTLKEQGITDQDGR